MLLIGKKHEKHNHRDYGENLHDETALSAKGTL
jgi:hypothetical protein